MVLPWQRQQQHVDMGRQYLAAQQGQWAATAAAQQLQVAQVCWGTSGVPAGHLMLLVVLAVPPALQLLWLACVLAICKHPVVQLDQVAMQPLLQQVQVC